jgi:3'-phosphoadenosine 5'-phosphosulfate sulfotransferase (PAPS reductase)/FAD synthetase
VSNPDWFYMMSGGKDSVAAALLVDEAIQANYQKTPTVVYLDTGVGVPYNRFYVEELCDRMGWMLMTLRTWENYEDRVQENGCPGPADHSRTYNALKGRQFDKIATWGDPAVCVTGINKNESEARANSGKADYSSRRWHAKPIFEWSEERIDEYVEENAPVKNPLWERNYFQDCACGAMASPEELLDAEADGFEWFVQRIREYEESAEFADKRGTWGWGGTSQQMQQALDHANDPDQMTLCGPSCGRIGETLDGDSGRE